MLVLGVVFLTGIVLVVCAAGMREQRFFRVMMRRELTLREVWTYGALMLVTAVLMRVVAPGIVPRPLTWTCATVLMLWTASFFRLNGPTFTAAVGTVANYATVAVNGFSMPAHGLSEDLSVHAPMSAATRLPFLGDTFLFWDARGNVIGGFSIGDCLLVIGVWWLVARLWTEGRA